MFDDDKNYFCFDYLLLIIIIIVVCLSPQLLSKKENRSFDNLNSFNMQSQAFVYEVSIISLCTFFVDIFS